MIYLSCRFVLNMAYAEGIHVDFEQTKDYMRFKMMSDFENYVKRLKALPARVSFKFCLPCLFEVPLISVCRSVHALTSDD